MAEKSFGLAVSEVGTAKGRVASFTAAPYGTGSFNQYGKIIALDTLWSDVFFHRLFLNVFMWCFRNNINYAEGDGVYVFITDPENDYIRAYFDSSLTQFSNPVKQSFGWWSGAEPFTSMTNGGLNLVWTNPWYEDDTTANMNNYHKASCHIILPSLNATRGLRMPDDRQAEIIRNVADMVGHTTDEDSINPPSSTRNGFYNVFSDESRGCGLITFEWFHYLQQIRPGGAFTIQDPSKYVKLYNPDDVAWRQMAKSSSQVMHTVSGLYDLTPVDVDNNSIILSAAEQIKYTKETIEEGEPFHQAMEDTLGLGVPDTIEFEPKIETESYDATMSRLAVLKNNPLVTSAAIYTTNITAAVATTTTTTTTTTTRSPSEQTRVRVGEVKIIDSCGPYNMSISGRDASYFELDNNIIYLLSTNPPPGFLKIEILLEDHFRPKRFPDIRRPFEIEFDQCKAPIIADRTAANRMPAYSYRRPQADDFNIEAEDEYYVPPDPAEMLWSVTRPSIAITPFTEYTFSGEGTPAKPFKAELGGGHADSNVLWLKVQDFLAFTFPYTISFKIVADSAEDEDFFLYVAQNAEDTFRSINFDTLPSSPTYNKFSVQQGSTTTVIDGNHIDVVKEVSHEFSINTIPSMYRNDLAVSSTDPAAGGHTLIPHGVSGVSYSYSGPYKNKITLDFPSDFSNPSTDPADGGKSVMWIYHPTLAFLYNNSIKLLVDEPKSVVPKQHYSDLNNARSFTNSIQQYLNIPTNGFDASNHNRTDYYNTSVIEYLSSYPDYSASPSDPDWLTRNWFQEYPNFNWMKYTASDWSSDLPRTGGIATTGEFVVKGPAHNAVNIVFGYMKDTRTTTGRDKCSIELVVNATPATTTTTTTTAEPTTTTTTTLPPLYDFEVEMIDINPPTGADVLSGDVAPASSQTVGSNANSITKEVREGQVGEPTYVFEYTAPAGQYYTVKPTLIILESNPSGFLSYTTNVTLDYDKFGGEARVTLTDIPPEGTIGERKYLKFLIQGATVPTTTTTTTTPVPTTTTTTTTTPPPCNNLIDILCKQTIRCTYNSFTDECDTQIIGHEIVAETCCNIPTASVNILVNNYLDLNPSQRSGCVSNTALYAPCNDPNDDNVCETIVEEYKFIASISCT